MQNYKTLLQDNRGGNLDDLCYGNDFLNTTPNVCSMKEVTDKLDFIKIKKKFCSAKDSVKKMRNQATECYKIFAKDIS